MVRGLGSFVLVGGSDLLNGNELSVPRAAIAHAGGVGFCRLTLPKVEGATPVGRPRAVIVADDSLCFAVAECDVVGGQVASPFERGCPDGRQARVATGFMSGRSTHAQEVTQMPRTAPGSLSLETQDREKARPLHPSYS
jgi:hypothetical protein